MIKEFCKKCYGKIFCVENEPQMNADDIIYVILSSLTDNSENKSKKLLYKYFLPNYRLKLGGYNKYNKWITNKFPGLINTINIELLNKFKEIDECHGFFIISYLNKNKRIILKINMERAYEYINNQPLYDKYTKEKLYLFWRISRISIDNDKIRIGKRVIFGRE